MSRKDNEYDPTRSKGSDRGHSERSGEGGGSTRTTTSGGHQTLVADHEDFTELSSRTYFTFEEDANIWAREIRNLPTGTAFLRLVDHPQLYEVDVKRSASGYLAWDMDKLARELPEALDGVERLVEENFRSEFFVGPEVIEAETRERLHAVLHPQITVRGSSSATTAVQEAASTTVPELFS